MWYGHQYLYSKMQVQGCLLTPFFNINQEYGGQLQGTASLQGAGVQTKS